MPERSPWSRLLMSMSRLSRFAISTRCRWLLSLAAVLAMVALVYAPTVDDYFGGDDFLVLGPVRAVAPWDLVWRSVLAQDGIPYWRPLVAPLYALEVRRFGLTPWPYHLIVIALHLLNVALLAQLAWALTGRRWLALAAALIFGIHPAKTTTVAMISSTVELFSMGWYLTVLLCCLRWLRGGHAARRWYWASVAAFVLGLLAKESVASAAAVVTVLCFLFHVLPAWRATGQLGRAAGGFLLRVLPFWVLVVPYTALTFHMTRQGADDYARAMYFVGPHIGQNLWWFLARLAVPLELGEGPHVDAAGHAGAALLLLAAAVILVRGTAEVRCLLLWMLLALTPLALWRPEYLLGRFTYMATAPFAILLALAGAWLVRCLGGALPHPIPRWTPAAALLVGGSVVLGGLTVDQSRDRTREGDTYRLLVSHLQREYPVLPAGSRVVLLNGVWSGPFHAIFLNAVADTLYGPGCVRILNSDAPSPPPAAVTGPSVWLQLQEDTLDDIQPLRGLTTCANCGSAYCGS